jgi:protein SCO1/2
MIDRRSLLAAGLGLALLGLAGCDIGGRDKPFNGVDLTGASYAQQLALTDQNGQPRTLGDFKGKVTVVFFGYTQCPDVCPATMAELAEVRRSLGKDGERVQGVFVTVDPERDTQAVLKSYMAGFDPSFVALRGTPEQTQAVAKEFKIFYAKVPGKEPGSYTVDHSAVSYVFDTNGRIRLLERYQTSPQALAEDLKRLM